MSKEHVGDSRNNCFLVIYNTSVWTLSQALTDFSNLYYTGAESKVLELILNITEFKKIK